MTGHEATTTIAVPRRELGRALVTLPLLFLALAIPIEWLAARRGWVSLVTDLFRLSGEGTIPTWYSSVLLLACGGSLLLIGHQRRSVPLGRHADWTLLGALFVYMSMDETAQIHELLNGSAPGQSVYFTWIIPAGVIVLLLGVRFLPFLMAQPRRLRTRMLVAAIVYVGAALGMEIPLGLVAEQSGTGSLGYRLVDTAEEFLEIVGLTVFLLGLLDELAALRPRLELREPDPPRPS